MFENFEPIFEQNANVNFITIFEKKVNFGPIFGKKCTVQERQFTKVNVNWPTAVAGEADTVSSVSASACHIR